MRMICYGFSSAALLAMLAFAPAASAQNRAVDGNGNLDTLIARHAAAHNVPESLIRRVIKRESGGNPRAISKGNYGLMQIRLGTARAMGYRGGIAGLLDADTNMTYAVKYLAGAYKVAGGNHDQSVRYYAAGYYYAAKRKRIATPVTQQFASVAEQQPAADVPGKMGPADVVAASDTPDPRGAPGMH